MTVSVSEHQPFSQSLRRATAAAHDRAHHSAYMDALLGGRLALDDYATLVAQYWFVYSALEHGADRLADHPVVGGFAVDALRRRPAIAADLAFLRGTGWAEDIRPLPSTAAYVARIGETVEDWPGGWVAHHYTRYLGDIAGGQVVRVLLDRTYGITGDGARFYDFAALGPVPPFRARYRGLLDAAAWDDDERARIVDEACHAFELNIAMLDELADTVPPEHLAA